MAKPKFKVGTKVVYKKDDGTYSKVEYVISHKTVSSLDSNPWTIEQYHSHCNKIYGCDAVFLSDKRKPKSFAQQGWMPENRCFKYTKAMKVLYGKS